MIRVEIHDTWRDGDNGSEIERVAAIESDSGYAPDVADDLCHRAIDLWASQRHILNQDDEGS